MLEKPFDIISDGQIHRFRIGKKTNKNGWYIFFSEGKYGVYGNWATGEKVKYKDDNYQITEDDKKRIAEAIKSQEIEQAKKWEEVSELTLELIQECKVTGSSDYLKNKKIKSNNALFFGNKIILPLQDSSGKVWSYQEIYADGRKMFASGGRIRGCFFKIQGNDEKIIVCEGFATGASIHEATGFTVICAMNAGNLRAVCLDLLHKNIIIAADNDESGIGEAKAKETGYPVVFPPNVGDDFSDLWMRAEDIKAYFIEEKKEQSKPIKVGGMVGAIAEWITETAIKPQPELSLAAAISFVSMLKGHRVCGTTNLHPNLFILSLAKTGTGKEHPFNCISWLASALQMRGKLIGIPTSGSAIATGLKKANGCGLLPIDEFGRFIGGINNKNAQNFQTEIIDFMISIYSRSGGTFYGKQYADDKTNPQIILENPYLCVYGTTIKEKLQAACNSAGVIDGFLNRWLIFKTDETPEEQYSLNIGEIPSDLIEKIEEWTARNIINTAGKFKKISFTKEAFTRFTEYKKTVQKKQNETPAPLDALYSRLGGLVEKMAIVLCDEDLIGITELETAIKIVDNCHANMLEFTNNISDTQHEADLLYVLDKIKEHKKITQNHLTRITQKINQKTRNDILSQLIESEQIAIDKTAQKTVFIYLG